MPLHEHVRRLAAGKNFATVVTLMPDGSPQAQLVWIDTDGEHLLVNTERERQRSHNVARDPRVSVLLVAADDPYDTAEVRGRVVEVVGGPEGRAHIDTLARKYTGGPYSSPIGSERIILKIAADREIVR